MKPSSPLPLSEVLLLTEKQMAQQIQVSHRTLLDWRQRGRVPYLRCGNLVRYAAADVLARLKRDSTK